MSGDPQPTDPQGDPLLQTRSDADVSTRRLVAVLGTVLVHGAAAVALLLAGGPAVDSRTEEPDEPVEVEIVSTKPEPEPEPTPPPEPEPEPEVQKPEPKPEPEPEPKSEPEPEPEPERKPEPKPPEEPADEKSDGEPESMDPVHLEGLTQESTVEGGEGPTIKTGEGIEEGRITDRYVAPEDRDDIQTGAGDGAGKGSSATPGGGKGGTRNCPEREAKVRERVRVDPEDYPVAAKRRGVQGKIVALLTVDTDGSVTDVKILQGLGHGLDELAREAFEKWTFRPAEKNCRTAESKVRITHEFRLRR